MELPHSIASERNQAPILNILKEYSLSGEVLEIGHGTGQHALYFTETLNVLWQPADVDQNNWMMEERLKREPKENVLSPIPFQVGPRPVKDQIDKTYDAIFTANTLHIMGESHVHELMKDIHQLMKPEGKLFLYGPFKFEGQFTSESNQNFDLHLKSQNPLMGIRDFEVIRNLLEQSNIKFYKRHDLPANNQLLVFHNES